MWVNTILLDSPAVLLRLSNDLILFTRYKSNTKSVRLQCSIISAQDFHISRKALPKVFTLPFLGRDSFLRASAIKSMIPTLCLGAGMNSDSWIYVLTMLSKSNLLHFGKNPSFVRKRAVNVISYEN